MPVARDTIADAGATTPPPYPFLIYHNVSYLPPIIAGTRNLIMQLLQALATMMVAVHAGRGGNGNGNGNGMGGTDGPTSHPTSRPTTSYPTAIPTAIDPGTFKVRTAGNCNGAT